MEARIEMESDGQFKFENYAHKYIFIADDTIQSVRLEAELREVPGQDKRQIVGSIIKQLEADMVQIPAGEFRMGNIQGHGQPYEEPVHRVSVDAFWLGKTEITFDQWYACLAAGGCSHNPADKGSEHGSRPVTYVSWKDITDQFIPWLSKTTGKQYRLPTEAEWEYAARAGSETKYSWGNQDPVCRDGASNGARFYDDKNCDYIGTAPVASYSANAFDLYDMHGNVNEWTQDCYNYGYQGAPSDGSAWVSGKCDKRVMRGGDYSDPSYHIRSASRHYHPPPPDRQWGYFGFRLARTLD